MVTGPERCRHETDKHPLGVRRRDERRGADPADVRIAGDHAVGRHFDRLGLAAALDDERKGLARACADRGDQCVPRVDRLVGGAHDAIARDQPGAIGRSAGHDLPDHRLERRPVQAQAYAIERVGLDVVGGIAAQIERRLAQVSPLILDLQAQGLALQCGLQHAPAKFLPGSDGTSIHCLDRVAGMQARRGSHARRGRFAEYRPGFGQSVHEKPGVDQDGEDEVEHRASHDDDEAAPHALAVEGTVQLMRRDRAFALVEHLDVAAERHCGDHPFRAVGATAPQGEWSTKAHGEAQDLHAAKPRDDVVPVLVHHDQHAQRDDESNQGLDETHAARPMRTRSPALLLAIESASRTWASESAGPAPRLCSVASITAGMAVNGRRPARNA
jgi:hypothetical protein